MGGDAIGKVEELLEKGVFRASVCGDISPPVGIADDRTNCDSDNINQLVVFAAVDARIWEGVKMSTQRCRVLHQ